MATSSVTIPPTRRGWSGHVTVLSQAAKSRIPNTAPSRLLTLARGRAMLLLSGTAPGAVLLRGGIASRRGAGPVPHIQREEIRSMRMTKWAVVVGLVALAQGAGG